MDDDELIAALAAGDDAALRTRGPGTAPLEETPPADPDPAEAALARADIAAALAGSEGQVLRLIYVEGRPVAGVAALLGVPAVAKSAVVGADAGVAAYAVRPERGLQ